MAAGENAIQFQSGDGLKHNTATTFADSQIFVFSCWFKRTTTGAEQFIRFDRTSGSSTARFNIGINSSNQISMFARAFNTDVTLLSAAGTTAVTDTDWHHLLIGWDASVGGNRHVYLDDVAESMSGTVTTGTAYDLNIGSNPGYGIAYNTNAAAGTFVGDLAEVFFHGTVALDVSNTTNRRKFIDASGFPVELGSDGSTPLGVQPWIYLPPDAGSVGNNLGTTADFTLINTPVVVSGPQDDEAPTITITSPTSAATYATSASTIDISGTASDNASVASVAWDCDTDGSGAATGTTSWSKTGIPLAMGENVITVTAADPAGNEGTDTLTVTRASVPTVESTCPADGVTLQNDDTLIHITFDQDMDDSTFAAGIDVVKDGATTVAGAWAYDDSDPFVATFTPDDPLEFDSIYTVTVTTDVESALGIPFAAAHVFRFRLRKAINWADREPFQFIEIVQPLCANTYGDAPCTAEVGVTGDRKCYNTRRTCQDPANYAATKTLTWRFCKPAVRIPHRLYAQSSGNIETNPIPSLVSVSTSPTYINVSAISDDESPMGRRASVMVNLKDHPFDDHVGDPYLADRDFNPMTRGSFWAKWLARNPYYANYTLRVYDGFINQPLSKMSVREYFIDKIDGPDSGGGVKITAKDILRLADDKRAQFPPVSELTLAAEIDDNQTTGILVNGLLDPLLVIMGNTSVYHLRIDREIILYETAIEGDPGVWELDTVTRGALNTEAASHRIDQACQRVGHYDEIEPWEAVRNLLEEWTDIPDSYIDEADWDAEGLYLSTFFITGTVAEPTPVIELIGEIAAHCGFYVWWDERQKTIRMKAIRPEIDVPEVNDCLNILKDSVAIREEPKHRVSRVFIYYNQRNPVEKMDNIGNFDSVYGRIDADAEHANEYGESRSKSIYSRWLRSETMASQLSGLIIRRFRDNPKYVTISVDARDGQTLWTADVVDVEHRNLVDDTGAKLSWRGQIVSAEEKNHGEIVEYILQRFEFNGRYLFWMDDDAPEFGDATEAEVLAGGFWCDDDGLMGDGSEGYKWQ